MAVSRRSCYGDAMMMRFGLILVVVLAAAGCDAGMGRAGGGGAIAGRVTLGPIMPVCREGVPCNGVYKNAKVEVHAASGPVVARTITDANGDFRADVAAGTYKVAVAVDGMLPRCTEAEAVVSQGQTVQVAIDCDTGIR